MGSKTFRIFYREVRPGQYEESHEDPETGVREVIGMRYDLPVNARPVDEAGDREVRQQRRSNEAMDRYQRLRERDPEFDRVRERMVVETANMTPEEVERLDSDPVMFGKVYDAHRQAELRRDHEQRKEAIRQLQFSANAQEREAGDAEMMAEHERYQREQEALRTGNFKEEGEDG